ncbi:MAG: hypothetical protein GY943_34240, partial [Chloroflexi bacterium]|nr:hypothetical protein [Chloroflexota bacterium]
VLDEEERFKTAVPEQSKVNLRRWNSAQTVHFSCLAFSFHGGDLEESYQLEKLFKQGGEQVLTVVDRTYQQLARWYDRGRYKNTAVSLDTYYRNRFALSAEIDLRTLDEKVADLCEKGVSSNVATMQTAGSHLVVTLNAQTERHLLHPISWLRGATLSARTGLIWGITHGRVHVETILGNANGDAWLIDFAQVEQAPLLIDFVSLETAVKTNLINSRQITDRYQLELLLRQSMSSNALTSAESFPVELISCAALIFKIRENAAQILNIDL